GKGAPGRSGAGRARTRTKGGSRGTRGQAATLPATSKYGTVNFVLQGRVSSGESIRTETSEPQKSAPAEGVKVSSPVFVQRAVPLWGGSNRSRGSFSIGCEKWKISSQPARSHADMVISGGLRGPASAAGARESSKGSQGKRVLCTAGSARVRAGEAPGAPPEQLSCRTGETERRLCRAARPGQVAPMPFYDSKTRIRLS